MSTAVGPGPSSPLGPDKLDELARSGEIDEVIVAVPDLHGRLQGSRVAARHFLDRVQHDGLPACTYLLACDLGMQAIAGGALDATDDGFGDLVLHPDLATMRVLPWEPRTALVLADAHHPGGGPVAVAPRQILRRQLERLAERGLAADVGLELELRVFRHSYDEAHELGYHRLRPASRGNIDYSLVGLEGLEPVVGALRRTMTAAGLHLESARGECAAGQYEIVFRYRDALGACDDAVFYKTGAKILAERAGASISFMAKVDADEGSSCHIHASLTDTRGEPVLADAHTPDGWSTVMRGFVAGQLDAMADLALCFAPGLNSWKRLQPGSFAPTSVSWGHDDRSSAVRVVGRGPSLRIEHRVPGADANPYLAAAAVIAGAVHGLDAQPALPADTATRTTPAPALPRHLHEALARWEASPLAHKAFGEDVVVHLAAAARHELDAFAGTVTDWERARGFERA